MALIPDDIIADIRSRADIVAVIGQHVKLRKAGQSHKGLCPFHNERSPSFNVHGDRGFFYCFGCQKKGDVFTFLMEYEGKTFHEAAAQLAEATGVTIPAADPGESERRSARGEMLRVNAAAAAFFRAELEGERGAAARAYLAERGIGDAIAAEFRLGYAPDDWRALGDHLAANKVSLALAETLGLIAKQPRAGGHYDRFRHRLVCPVIQPGGDVVGFSARTLPGGKSHHGDEPPAKYFNSPESPLYKKSRLLYGVHRAQQGFRRKGRAVLVEGNFDVVSLHQAGVEEAVAPLGTALTEEQVDVLRRYVGQVVLLYDGDGAGRAATLKSLKLLCHANVEVRIATIPLGEDPDSLARRGGQGALGAILGAARAGVEYFIDEVWSRTDGSADSRAAALHEAADVLRSVADPTKRDFLVGTFAAALSTDVATLRQGLRRALQGADRDGGRRPASTPTGTGHPGASTAPGRGTDNGGRVAGGDDGAQGGETSEPVAVRMPPPPSQELQILCLIADHPSLLELAEHRDLLSLLTDPRVRDMYSAARAGNTMWWSGSTADRAMTEKLLAREYARVPDPGRTLDDCIANLSRAHTTRRAAQLNREIEQAQRRGDAELSRRLNQQMVELLSPRKQVD